MMDPVLQAGLTRSRLVVNAGGAFHSMNLASGAWESHPFDGKVIQYYTLWDDLLAYSEVGQLSYDLHWSSDWGKTWKATSIAGGMVPQIIANTQTMYGVRVGKQGVDKSDDGGNNWRPVTTELPVRLSVLQMFSKLLFQMPKQGAMLFGDSLGQNFFSLDDGAHWQALPN
jgi:hypothetical protein